MNTNRKFIGIERDENYFAIARKRIGEAQLASRSIPTPANDNQLSDLLSRDVA